MDIKQLSYFIRIAQEESYSAAASKMMISQPALSMAVKNLEKELGVSLFYAFGGKQLLTDDGKNLYTHAQRLMDVFRETVDAVGSHTPESFGNLSIGLPPIIGTCYFSELVADFSNDYPNVSITIVEEGAREIEGMVEKGVVDIGCTIGPLYSSDFERKRIITEQNVVLLPKDHELSKRESIKLEELRGEAFAIFNKHFLLHDQIMDGCKAAGFTPKITVLSSQWDFQAEVVSKGRAVSILPEPIVARFPLPEIAVVPLHESAGVLKFWDVFLVWGKKRYLSKVCETFLRYAETIFKDK